MSVQSEAAEVAHGDVLEEAHWIVTGHSSWRKRSWKKDAWRFQELASG